MTVCICGDVACKLPLCGCGEWHATIDGRCRDCDIQHCLDRMECSVCRRMRYRQDVPRLTEFGVYLWGEPCDCDPKPPSLAEQRSEAAR